MTSSVTIPPDYQGPVTLVVRQAVNTQSFDPVPANNSAVVTTTIGSGTGADLSISKAGPATTNRGQQVTYTIMVANAGPAGATGVTVHDPTPAGLTFVSNGGDCVTAFPCDLATMAAGHDANHHRHLRRGHRNVRSFDHYQHGERPERHQ